jgi:hypothetical protein
MTSMCHHTQLLVEMGISPTFIPGWPLTAVLQISASCVAGITDMSHHAHEIQMAKNHMKNAHHL